LVVQNYPLSLPSAISGVSVPGLPERIGKLVGLPVTGFRPAGGQHGYSHMTGTLADGRPFFAKATASDAPAAAAHGGHRETDLAMLALFGAPRLEEIIRGYTGASPLAEGWRARVPLHQLHPLLVHVCLFGRSYVSQLTTAARAALAP
jgi:Fructosamine kinase